MTIICITDYTAQQEIYYTGTTLAEVARTATEDRVGEITADTVTPMGGTDYHTVDRDVDPEAFWLAQLAWTMSDAENFGYGASKEEALAHVRSLTEVDVD